MHTLCILFSGLTESLWIPSVRNFNLLVINLVLLKLTNFHYKISRKSFYRTRWNWTDSSNTQTHRPAPFEFQYYPNLYSRRIKKRKKALCWRSASDGATSDTPRYFRHSPIFIIYRQLRNSCRMKKWLSGSPRRKLIE